MSLRTRAREIVLQLLYQDDLNRGRSQDEDMAFIRGRLHNAGNIRDFAKSLLDGVRAKSKEIDRELDAATDNWKISRMAATDRNVLRLGAYEILFHDTPAPVAINEAIEIAKRYGDEQSSQFINGILDRLIKKQLRLAKQAAATSKEEISPSGLQDSIPHSELKPSTGPIEPEVDGADSGNLESENDADKLVS